MSQRMKCSLFHPGVGDDIAVRTKSMREPWSVVPSCSCCHRERGTSRRYTHLGAGAMIACTDISSQVQSRLRRQHTRQPSKRVAFYPPFKRPLRPFGPVLSLPFYRDASHIMVAKTSRNLHTSLLEFYIGIDMCEATILYIIDTSSRSTQLQEWSRLCSHSPDACTQ